ncbi:aspartyl protease family protein [Chryseobacterium chendengshani]|uniref:aspartyl protease family protein n=1 Tax=Chryseobacterium sp. LJ668 TaxID=2864040 RepID=UPI001C68AC70|nr:aspartyl protease family protein [Chryseobacterium sp. LJ668]MBW8522840.1 aspartyl protease family protein [Chryseobacterium sp. LJ668]QYK16372.1 aspartyl protease family protein [Chryseobacterium sp. LJ668]
MKKSLFIFLICYITSVSAQGKRFFESGEVVLINPVEKINLTFANELPLVNVFINGKPYQFLFDTGAPTVISSAVYNELNLKKKHTSKVGDSQKNKQQQIFTELPEMIVDQIVFKNIGAVVLDLEGPEFGCLKIDGIIGANQMAKLFWRINYSENLLEAAKDLKEFSTNEYETVFNFKPKPQKTPMIESQILDKKMNLTFDTGFTGGIKISENNYDPQNGKVQSVETYGVNSVGAYGTGKPLSSYHFRANEVMLAGQKFENEIIMTGNSGLVGNEFLKKFKFIIDWQNNKVYLHRLANIPPKLESFGFAYRFIDLKAKVVLVFQGTSNPIKIDDEILSINNASFENLDKASSCNYLLNRVEKGANQIKVKVKREGKILDFTVDRKEYLNN